MPNWCNNNIVITGSKENMKPLVKKFRELEDTKENVMETIIGTPDKPKNYDGGGWYNYNCERFGCKWDFPADDIPTLSIEDERIEFDCMTAWAPPNAFLENLCKMYKVEAVMKYAEPGMDFAGVFSVDEEGGGDESMSYLEGVYHLFDHFWEDVDMYAEMAVENEEETLDDFMEQFDFITNDNEIDEIKQVYLNHIEMKKTFD